MSVYLCARPCVCVCVCLETRLMELHCGCQGNVTSSDGAQLKSVIAKLGVSLPKRAETFTAFDSKQKFSGNNQIIH